MHSTTKTETGDKKMNKKLQKIAINDSEEICEMDTLENEVQNSPGNENVSS